ncbi:MAG: hypothetical protein GX792_11435 [Bacteroidales bacterium]|jgi:hypothetical protein|nr:hypothetical protein [Bacteroidales bacterium]
MVICHPYAGTSRNATPDDKGMNEVEKRLRGNIQNGYVDNSRCAFETRREL